MPPPPPLFFLNSILFFFNRLFLSKTHFKSPQCLQHFSVIRFKASTSLTSAGLLTTFSVIAKFKLDTLTGCTEIRAQILLSERGFPRRHYFCCQLSPLSLIDVFHVMPCLAVLLANSSKNEKCKSFLQVLSLEPAKVAPNSKCKMASRSSATRHAVKCLFNSAVLAEESYELFKDI